VGGERERERERKEKEEREREEEEEEVERKVEASLVEEKSMATEMTKKEKGLAVPGGGRGVRPPPLPAIRYDQ